MSRRRAERLVNLVLCLLSTRRFLTAEQIARIVPGYEHDATDSRAHEAFQRMFERDKAELRELGVPIETGTSSVFDAEPGYRVAPGDYSLPEISLEPDEAAAVGLAVRLWQNAGRQSAGLALAASRGLRKIRAAGVEIAPPHLLGIEPVIAADPALEPLLAAVRTRRVVRFMYAKPREFRAQQRQIQPWGVVCMRGRWYVVGFDVMRGAARAFRLSRIQGEVRTTGPAKAFEPPADLDLASHVGATRPERVESARVKARPGVAAGLRREATHIESGEDGDVLTVPFADVRSFASRLASYGSAVVVLDPPEVRDAVVVRLKALSEVPVS
ncbi:MAG: WYL domain-containing protein [Corynebacteriales bacterium]|nr:WYL domain-containing protein [Mycobacteriales bacterium]